MKDKKNTAELFLELISDIYVNTEDNVLSDKKLEMKKIEEELNTEYSILKEKENKLKNKLETIKKETHTIYLLTNLTSLLKVNSLSNEETLWNHFLIVFPEEIENILHMDKNIDIFKFYLQFEEKTRQLEYFVNLLDYFNVDHEDLSEILIPIKEYSKKELVDLFNDTETYNKLYFNEDNLEYVDNVYDEDDEDEGYYTDNSKEYYTKMYEHIKTKSNGLLLTEKLLLDLFIKYENLLDIFIENLIKSKKNILPEDSKMEIILIFNSYLFSVGAITDILTQLPEEFKTMERLHLILSTLKSEMVKESLNFSTEMLTMLTNNNKLSELISMFYTNKEIIQRDNKEVDKIFYTEVLSNELFLNEYNRERVLTKLPKGFYHLIKKLNNYSEGLNKEDKYNIILSSTEVFNSKDNEINPSINNLRDILTSI